ncbi:MAG: alpha/beta hydrolase [Deltaproteobacteria bacterium]|jgi:predicted peptidase|nr:alpha/beta hydrolase [Deltaproteobacteria bacterium]
MKILFLHGLESGPHGSKYQALKEIFGEIIAPDCTGVKDEAERLRIIQTELSTGKETFLVVGSSMGGLMALILQQANPDAVAGMVLCAPAIHRPAAEALNLDNLPPTTVIHGTQDEVVPFAASKPFGKRLIAVADDHRLSNSMTEILRAVFEMQLTLSGFDKS